MPPTGPLTGRIALVTGISRDLSIAATVARRLHELGAVVHATGWPTRDREMPWGHQPLSPLPFTVHQHDLEQAETNHTLIDEVIDAHGRLDIVVAAHARSSFQPLSEVEATELDRGWAVNVRSIVLLAQRFAQVHEPAPPAEPPSGRMIWFTSGQHIAPMGTEIAYAVSKGALHQMTATINHSLSESRIVANCINPGPVDTGYDEGDAHHAVRSRFPDQRWGTPDDIGNLVEFLATDSGGWIRGQVINAEGGFDRFNQP
ncbi:SDR family oxidoreductase [Candidatus Poriferisodalis sp.]|uniref:SDR family oxidoreductase n=1 Tax=Candidatus Poriferisodalis sp. TaxID=3101277 RepID=UPI003C6FDCCF